LVTTKVYWREETNRKKADENRRDTEGRAKEEKYGTAAQLTRTVLRGVPRSCE